MTALFVLQLLIPVVLVLWLWRWPPGNRLGWAVQTLATLLLFAVAARVGIWLYPPWWTPHFAALAVLAAVLLRWPHAKGLPWLPPHSMGWLGCFLFVVLAAASAQGGARAWAGARPPPVSVVSLAWPLQEDRFLVANGGNDILINAHLASFASNDPRLLLWRGNRWAVDLVAINAIGVRAAGFRPTDPGRYRIFGLSVRAPCSGKVVVAVDGLPDMQVPAYDRAHPAGNHVMLACGDAHIALAHFRQGSVRVHVGETVQVGQLLAQVGNSGGSNEPHLHIHAQRPGSATEPMGGEPLPMLLGGRFLVRGDRMEVWELRP
jgi:hypothetical protein